MLDPIHSLQPYLALQSLTLAAIAGSKTPVRAQKKLANEWKIESKIEEYAALRTALSASLFQLTEVSKSIQCQFCMERTADTSLFAAIALLR
jgi:hypothetical protein